MSKEKRINKIVGIISDEIVEKYKLYEYRDKKIVQSLDLYIHIQKHIPEFKDIASYNHTIKNIEDILFDPYYVFYDCRRKSLLYFKYIDEDVCVVVKLALRKNIDCYVATIYPVSRKKINRYIESDKNN